jgi:hypothetical protein
MSDAFIKGLGQRYKSLSDDELRFIASAGGLTEEAKAVLDRELTERGIRDVQAYREALDRDDALRRAVLKNKLEEKDKFNRLYNLIGFGLFVLCFLAGVYRLFVEGNDIDGPGIMMASLFIPPFLFVRYYAYRFIWRLLLRP